MGRFVIVAYKPKPRKADRLFAVVKKHIAVLRSENLVSEKAAYVMRAADGTLVEVFEWRDPAAIEAAHKSEAVSALGYVTMDLFMSRTAIMPSMSKIGDLTDGDRKLLIPNVMSSRPPLLIIKVFLW